MTRLGLAALAAWALLAAPAGSHPGHAPPTVSVAVYDYAPREVTVTQGDIVQWTFDGPDYDHSVTTEKGAPAAFDSGVKTKQATFEYYFEKAGTYKYFCTVHGNMRGTVIVNPSSQTVDTVAPKLTGAKLAAQTRRRARFTFSVDEDSSITTELRRRGTAKVLRRSFGFVKAGRAKASVKLAGLRHGRYVATLIAADPTGNTSAPAKVKVRR